MSGTQDSMYIQFFSSLLFKKELENSVTFNFPSDYRACVRNLELRAGAVCSIKESSGTQNQRVHIVLKASKSAGAKGDVPKICGSCTRCTRSNAFPFFLVREQIKEHTRLDSSYFHYQGGTFSNPARLLGTSE